MSTDKSVSTGSDKSVSYRLLRRASSQRHVVLSGDLWVMDKVYLCRHTGLKLVESWTKTAKAAIADALFW
jgi:hypothetical protein